MYLLPPLVGEDASALNIFNVGDVVWTAANQLACVLEPIVRFAVPFAPTSPLPGVSGEAAHAVASASANADADRFCAAIKRRMLSAVQRAVLNVRSTSEQRDMEVRALIMKARRAYELHAVHSERNALVAAESARGGRGQNEADACFPCRPVTALEISAKSR